MLPKFLLKSPSNINSFRSLKKLSCLAVLLTPVVLNKLLTGGYILLTSLSILLTCSIAKFASAALPAPSAFFPKNIASGLFDVGLTADTTLSIVLFILDELSTRSLPYPATLPTVLPAP